MPTSLHQVAVDSFAPMLDALEQIIVKAEAHAAETGQDLLSARLAPDMFGLAQQVHLACTHAFDAMERLAGRPAAAAGEAPTDLAGLRARLTSTVNAVRAAEVGDYVGAEARDCSIPVNLPEGAAVIALTGAQYLTAWALPNFYFHLVTAYDILRHSGVSIGKRDYMSGVAGFLRPA